MSEVQDLDIFVPENKKVKLGGKEYMLPGDLPMEVFLSLNAAQAKAEEDNGGEGPKDGGTGAIQALLNAMGDLFSRMSPEDQKPTVKAEVEACLRGRGVKYLMELVQNIYREPEVAEPEAEVPTEPSPEAGTTST